MSAHGMSEPVLGAGPPRRIRVHPSGLAGTVRVPGDKSISHRALMVGALVGAPVEVRGIAIGGDVAATSAALRTLGAEVTLLPSGQGTLDGTVLGPPRGEPGRHLEIDCANSGTTLRLMAGIVAGLPGTVVLDGDRSLHERPVDRVLAPLRAMGATCHARDDRRPPLSIEGAELTGIAWESPVASAQVKSCVLLAGLAALGPTSVTSPGRSRDHTERMLGAAGVDVERSVDEDGRETVRIAPGPVVATRFDVPADPSSAAFWAAAAACGAGTVELPDLCLNPTRDGALRVLTALGATVEVEHRRTLSGEPVGDVRVAPGRLGGAVLAGDLVVDALDELPVLALVGAMSTGGLEVRDAAELRVKESDRIEAVVRVLGALGIEVEGRADGYRVRGGQRPRGGQVTSGGDHRMAMTAAIAGVVGDGPVEIDGFDAVASSYPDFVGDLVRLGGRVEVLERAA